ncbi:hypothetical protein TNCV_3931181 [Trichonephila clavipes]|nr:hypothetical protein TNCV_3931181 [Trichonephila clavipes]
MDQPQVLRRYFLQAYQSQRQDAHCWETPEWTEKFHRPYRQDEKVFGVLGLLLGKPGPTVPHRLLHY